MHIYRSIRVRPERGAPLSSVSSVCLPLSLLEREEKSGEPPLASALLFTVVLLFLFIVNPHGLDGGCHVVLFLFLYLFLAPPFHTCFFPFFLSFHVGQSLSSVALSLYWSIQYMTPHLRINYHPTTKTSDASLSLTGVWDTPTVPDSTWGPLHSVLSPLYIMVKFSI